MTTRAEATIRPYEAADRQAAYEICLKTGDHGKDGEPFYREDPDALGRIYVGPYLEYEPTLALMLCDANGVAGYALAAFDSRSFFERYDRQWRPQLCKQYPDPSGEPASWTRVEQVYHCYHHPDYFCPEPYDEYPSHLHIDLLPRMQGRGFGRRMIERLAAKLTSLGSPGVHLGVSELNQDAQRFYAALGFAELTRCDDAIYLGRRL